MTGWEVQALKEAEDARIWEELNAPDPLEPQMKEAARDLGLAAGLIDKAEDEISAAVSDLSDTDLESKMSDLLDRLMDFRYEVQEIAEKYRKGERE